MVMAARPTQMPVLAGGGEEALTRRKSRPAGTRFPQPPLPEPWLGARSRSIVGGSWTVVAILLTPQFCAARREDYFSSYFSSCGFVSFSGEVCMMKSALAPSTLY